MAKPDFFIEDAYLSKILENTSDLSRVDAYARYLRWHHEDIAAETFGDGAVTFRRAMDELGSTGYRYTVIHPNAYYTGWIEVFAGQAVLNDLQRQLPVLVRLARICELLESRRATVAKTG